MLVEVKKGRCLKNGVVEKQSRVIREEYSWRQTVTQDKVKVQRKAFQAKNVDL